ncbi:MAG: deoxyribodipyrimidine photo-lyase [Chloroflexi bacterium]|nr:deoxyribodipyrimidine photo-lyase [Chloroflexota bacterium]
MTAIWWIRRDLRLTDNLALEAALKEGAVIPLFVIDPAFDSASPRRRNFLYEGLRALRASLMERGAHLIIRSGEPTQVLRRLLAETNVSAIFAEEDYTPYARARDARVARELPLRLVPGQVVQHPAIVKKSDDTPYVVYTPYSRAWKALLPGVSPLRAAPKSFPPVRYPTSESLPFSAASPLFPAGEEEALRRLARFTKYQITNYSDNRDRLDLDGTSSLSPYIRFGMLGMRQAVHAARQAQAGAQGEDERSGADVWLNELIWREFYIQILYHFPRVARGAFNSALSDIPWRNDEAEFTAWKQGRTGMPVVDAAMRQLGETGWMHNRARMIVASFLVKDMLVDWRWGEAWFMANLLDGDPAANNGGWQWTAGTGTDAAPYFRVFNPVLQGIKFDPNGDYVRKWVPELAHLDTAAIHAPWGQGLKVPGYPERPIITRDKERTLTAYRAAKESHSQ